MHLTPTRENNGTSATQQYTENGQVNVDTSDMNVYRMPSSDSSTSSTQGRNIITTHGWMHKQGKRRIKGPIHKSWKRRYFGMMLLFDSNVYVDFNFETFLNDIFVCVV